MKQSHWVHPEARLQVIKEYHRLRKRHSSLDGDSLWSMARDYQWTMDLADSSIIRCEIVSGIYNG